MEPLDVIVVGAGPIGLETAHALAREGASVRVLDAGPVGATLFWWAPSTVFFSSPERIAICGVPIASADQRKTTREEYLAYLRTIVQQFDLDVRTYHEVLRIERESAGGPFRVRVRTNAGEHDQFARHVVLAMGDMHKARTLDLPGEDLEHVSHYLRDPHVYFGRRVLIVGGKNSAVEAAIRLFRVGAHVTLAYRRAEFDKRVKYWLRPELEFLINKGKIGFHPCVTPIGFTPSGARLSPVDEELAPAGEAFDVEADDVLLLTGYVQNTTLLERCGIELVGPQRAPRHERTTMESNVPGMYVAGTAAAGTQVGGVKVFIETSHVHAERITRAITGRWTGPAEPGEHEHDALPEA